MRRAALVTRPAGNNKMNSGGYAGPTRSVRMVSMASTQDSNIRDRVQSSAGLGARGADGDRLTADLGEVQLDLDRQRRCGYPEAVYAEGKSVETLAKIFRRLLEAGEPVLATRISADAARALAMEFSSLRRTRASETGPGMRHSR